MSDIYIWKYYVNTNTCSYFDTFLKRKSIKNLHCIQIWNIAKPVTIMKQIGKKLTVMKPSMWMICHGSNSWPLQFLVATTNVNSRLVSLIPQPTHLEEATISCRLVIQLLNAPFKQSAPSQILFSITCTFATSHSNKHCSFSCKVTI
jgi:hypothetical protein